MRTQLFNSSYGLYQIAPTSGLITGVAAGTATAGHLFAARWAPATRPALCILTRFRAQWRTIAGFTAAQAIGMDLSILRGYTAPHTGGTAITIPGGAGGNFLRSKRPGDNAASSASAFLANNIQIAITGALTAGTHTFDATPIARESFSELAGAATVAPGRMDLLYDSGDRGPIVLAANEGICLRNTTLMGAGGTALLTVEMCWVEADQF